jgi:predicted DNA-binding protein (MmcQ/YjbR family)
MSGPKFIHLVFYNNPSDTIIKSVNNDQVLYQIKTVDDPEATLTLCNAQGEIIGSLHLKKRHSDLLTLGSQGPQIASSDWLKKARWGSTVTFRAQRDNNEYSWRRSSRELELAAKGDKATEPVARYNPVYSSRENPTELSERILLDERALAIMDDVVLSLIIWLRNKKKDVSIGSFIAAGVNAGGGMTVHGNWR